MPAGDGTGPTGMGPRTGRGAGYCAGFDAPGWAFPGPGRGLALGRGRGGGGRGWRNRYWFNATGVPGWARSGRGPAWGSVPVVPAPGREEEAALLRQQAEWLKQQLDAISQRIEELGQEK